MYSGKRAGLPSDVAEKMKALEQENRELHRVNEKLRKASAYFAMAPNGQCKHSPVGQEKARPPTEARISFADEHCAVLMIEPFLTDCCRLPRPPIVRSLP